VGDTRNISTHFVAHRILGNERTKTSLNLLVIAAVDHRQHALQRA